MKYPLFLISPVLLFLVSSVVSLPVSAANQFYGDVLVSEVTSIYDADTFRVNIKHWPDVIGKHVSIRVLGVDAPEIRGKCASKNLADALIKVKIARPYDGGTRLGWCG